jgi:hypothetical protein
MTPPTACVIAQQYSSATLSLAALLFPQGKNSARFSKMLVHSIVLI